MVSAVFAAGMLDVRVERSGESRFYLTGINRATGAPFPLGVARWEPGTVAFDMHLVTDAYFPAGSDLMQALVTHLDAIRSWYQRGEQPDVRLGIIFGDNTASR